MMPRGRRQGWVTPSIRPSGPQGGGSVWIRGRAARGEHQGPVRLSSMATALQPAAEDAPGWREEEASARNNSRLADVKGARAAKPVVRQFHTAMRGVPFALGRARSPSIPRRWLPMVRRQPDRRARLHHLPA